MAAARDAARAEEQKADELKFMQSAIGARLQLARTECAYGLNAAAQRDMTPLLSEKLGPAQQWQMAVMVAQCGDETKARQYLDGILKDRPDDTLLHGMVSPAVLASLDLRHGPAAKAIDDLAPAVTYDRAVPGVQSAQLRASAYLAAGQPAKALQEVQWQLTQKQSVGTVVYEVAQLTAARAYAAEGDKGRAREMYQDVLAAWKNADADLPLVQQARAEYAKLQ